MYSCKTGHVIYQAGSRWDPKYVFNLSQADAGHTNIRSKLVDIVTAGSQKNHPLRSSEDPPWYVIG